MPYDALKAPDPQAWLALGEQERIDEVIAYHRRYHLPMGGSAQLHAVAHVIVENQVAMGDPPAAREALARLMGEGLDRHDAVHAVGSIVVGFMYDVLLREKGKDACRAQKIGPWTSCGVLIDVMEASKDRYCDDLCSLDASMRRKWQRRAGRTLCN
jgi:hypothetical protein